MSVAVTCQCKTTFDLKDEFAGKMVKCPKCGSAIRVPGEKLTPKSQADPVFDRDVFLLRQKALAISEKYAVSDEAGQQILYIERPRHFWRNLMAGLGGVVAGILTFAALGFVAGVAEDAQLDLLAGILMVVTLLASMAAFLGVSLWLSKKRHVSFYRGAEKGDKLLEALQEKKWELFTTTFVVRDAKGHALGKLRKNQFSNLLRKKWRLLTFSGKEILIAKEDSIILSLLRRLLGPMFGLLRTNYVFVDGAGKHVGEFNRKFTILDRYVLDMKADAQRNVDRRLALAIGVILDTGDRR